MGTATDHKIQAASIIFRVRLNITSNLLFDNQLLNETYEENGMVPRLVVSRPKWNSLYFLEATSMLQPKGRSRLSKFAHIHDVG